jgi:hypothetical protein
LWDVLLLEFESHASPEVHEKPWESLEWTRDAEVRAGIRPVITITGNVLSAHSSEFYRSGNIPG